MKRWLTILFYFPLLCVGQNFVPNPGFEMYSSCPTSDGQIYCATPWSGVSCDFFNTCSTSPWSGVPSNWDGYGGYQFPHTGNGYVGFLAYVPFNEREYLQIPLTDSLTNGIVYRLDFYVNLANIEKYAIDAVGAFLSSTIISQTGYSLNFIPQVSNPVGNYLTDTLNWTKITGTFTAVGGEKYLTIGNFKADSLTNKVIVNPTAYDSSSAYYYVDDVALYPDSITTVTLLDHELNYSIAPNPATDELYISVSDKEVQSVTIEITDITGKRVYSNEITVINLVGQLKLDLDNGIYLVKITDNKNKKDSVQKIVINK